MQKGPTIRATVIIQSYSVWGNVLKLNGYREIYLLKTAVMRAPEHEATICCHNSDILNYNVNELA